MAKGGSFPLDERIRRSRSLFLTLAAIFIALVFLLTSAFTLSIPATQGYFNIGEMGVYMAALIGGPIIGGIGGGFGSLLADLYLGAPYYAPATLVIKAVEGVIVGYLSRKIVLENKPITKYFGIGIGIIAGIALFLMGTIFVIGSLQINLLFIFSVGITLGQLIWGIISALFVIFIIYLIVRNPSEIAVLLSMAAGGLWMISGYFIYEQFFYKIVSGQAAVAVAEVPFNTMQMLVGLTIAVYVYKAYKAII